MYVLKPRYQKKLSNSDIKPARMKLKFAKFHFCNSAYFPVNTKCLRNVCNCRTSLTMRHTERTFPILKFTRARSPRLSKICQ